MKKLFLFLLLAAETLQSAVTLTIPLKDIARAFPNFALATLFVCIPHMNLGIFATREGVLGYQIQPYLDHGCPKLALRLPLIRGNFTSHTLEENPEYIIVFWYLIAAYYYWETFKTLWTSEPINSEDLPKREFTKPVITPVM